MAEINQPLDTADQSLKTGTASKPVIANESVLAQMEQLYKNKLERNQYFLEDLKDAQAWWSGGAEGPTRSLAQRAQTRAAQEKELEDLARNIATTKIGLGQLQEANQSLQPAGISAPVMRGTAPTAGGAATPSLPVGWGVYRGVPVPPEVIASIQSYLRVGDIGKANAAFQEYAKTRGAFLNAPGTYEQKPFFDEQEGRTVQRTPLEIQELMLNRRPPLPAPVAPNVVAPVGPSTSMAPTATSQVNDVYRFENLSEPQQSRLKTEFVNLGLQGNVADLFNRSSVEKRKAAFEASGETPVTKPTSVTPPVATTPVAPKPRFGSKGEEDIFKKGQEEFVSSQQKKKGEAVGERVANLENSRTELNTRLAQANTIINILDTTPEAVGISFRNPTTGLIMKAAESGLIPFVGKKDLEEVMATQLPKEARINREKFDSIASNLSAEFRREAAKGTGQVSDYETKLFQKATGLEKTSPAEANRYFAVIAAENLRTKKQLLEAWEKQPKGADFSDFEKSAEYKQIQDQKVLLLVKIHILEF